MRPPFPINTTVKEPSVWCRRALMGLSSRGRRFQGGRRGYARVFLAVLLIHFCLPAGGCAPTIRMGHRPNIDALEKSLQAGVSTPADVLLALGQPFGKGKTMFPIDSKPRTMWSYYYGEGDLQDARATYLFVYFDENRYDGYMWFSSLQR